MALTGDVAERLWEVVEPYLEAEGVELDDLDVRGRGSGRFVRVTVDSPDGLGVDRIADLSRGLSRLLDDADPVPGSYTLEVSSPGLERTLRRPGHYLKAVGREVEVRTDVEVEGERHHRGILESVDEGALRLAAAESTRTIPMTAVKQAKTVFTWEKAPKPGGKRGTR